MEAYQLDTKLSFVNNSVFLSLCISVCVYVCVAFCCVFMCLQGSVCVCIYRYKDSFNGATSMRKHCWSARIIRDRSLFFLSPLFFQFLFCFFLSLYSLSFTLTHSFNIHSAYSLQNINYFPLFTDG